MANPRCVLRQSGRGRRTRGQSPRWVDARPSSQRGTGPDGKLWYEVRQHRTAPVGETAELEPPTDGSLYIATPCNRLVAAERSLRNFVQTLSKTFAHLPVGLAIFDQKRELISFNAALVELSTLDPRWLSGRPSLFE